MHLFMMLATIHMPKFSNMFEHHKAIMTQPVFSMIDLSLNPVINIICNRLIDKSESSLIVNNRLSTVWINGLAITRYANQNSVKTIKQLH